jgi:hypothetical protein
MEKTFLFLIDFRGHFPGCTALVYPDFKMEVDPLDALTWIKEDSGHQSHIDLHCGKEFKNV